MMRRDQRLIRLRAIRHVKLLLAGRRLGAAVQTVHALHNTALRIDRLRGDMWLQAGPTDGYAASATAAARAQLDAATQRQRSRLTGAQARVANAAQTVVADQAAVEVVDRALDRAAADDAASSLAPGSRR